MIDQRIAEYSNNCNLNAGRAKELCIIQPIACPNNTCTVHFGSTPTQLPSTPGVSYNVHSNLPTPATTCSVAPGQENAKLVTFGGMIGGLLLWHCSWFKFLSPKLDVALKHNLMHVRIVIKLYFIYTLYFSQQLACSCSQIISIFYFSLNDHRIAEYFSKCDLDCLAEVSKNLCVIQLNACPSRLSSITITAVHLQLHSCTPFIV